MATQTLEFQTFITDIATTIASHVAGASSGAPSPTPRIDAFFLDHEKVVWHSPDIASRVMEDLP